MSLIPIIPKSPHTKYRLLGSRCAICKEGHFSTSITSHHNSKTHNIKQSVTCKSNNVCYLIDCNKCKQQYVGETELEFHCRMNNHKSDIRLENKSNGMVRHFSKCGIDKYQSSDILQHSQNRPTGDRWLKF